MTESDLTKKFTTLYRQRRPLAVVYKVNDRVARSRPDVQITDYGQTWFLEMKRWDGEVSPGQAREADLLARASRGRMITVWFNEGGSVTLVREGHADNIFPTIADAVTTVESWIAARALDT